MFDIFDLAFSKIVDPTIFVRDLSFVWRASHEIFPLRGNFRRPLPPVHEVASHRRFCESSTSTVAASREGRRGRGDGLYLPVARGERKEVAWRKETAARGKEEFARGGGVLAGNYRSAWGGRARQGVQKTRDIKIVKPLCLCKNVKFGPSNAKFVKMHKSNA